MERNQTMITPPAVAVVQEPLAQFYPFIGNGGLLPRAQTPALVEAHLRWQYVRHGGINPYVQLELAPTGWEGYVVGLPPERQAQTLEALGQELLQRLQMVGHEAGVPADALLTEIAAGYFTPRTAHLLEPIFLAALTRMRTIGQTGCTMQAYSHWRTVYEQELSRLEVALRQAQAGEAKHHLLAQLAAQQWTLQQQLRDLTHGRLTAAALYQEVHQRVATTVNAVAQTVDQPLAVDWGTARVRYVLPAAPGLKTETETSLAPGTPEWYILVRNLPLLGHPLIRAAIDPQAQGHASR